MFIDDINRSIESHAGIIVSRLSHKNRPIGDSLESETLYLIHIEWKFIVFVDITYYVNYRKSYFTSFDSL